MAWCLIKIRNLIIIAVAWQLIQKFQGQGKRALLWVI
jgi:hypothetical protein